MAKIVFFEIEPWQEEYIRKHIEGHTLIFRPDKLTEKNAREISDAEIVSGMIWSEFPKNIVEQSSKLRYIATRSTGYDHIDLKTCKEKGIVVSNVPTYGAHTVAEHTFALLLALSRNIIQSAERTRQGDFSLGGLEGFDLNGKTIGVIGAGNIGKRVIQLAFCFGMKILVFTKTPDETLTKDYRVKFVALVELLQSSDIITLHVPHAPDTHYLINMDNLAIIKKGSILINTARGALIETQAIVEGLEKGIFKAAGLDVLEEECFLKEETQLLTEEFFKTCDIKTQLLNHVLLKRSDVIITPHNAFNSREALVQILETTVANICAYLSGKPKNTVEL